MAAHSAGIEPQLTGLDRIGWRATAHPETVVEVRNLLIRLENNLQRLNLTSPPLQTNFHAYLNVFGE